MRSIHWRIGLRTTGKSPTSLLPSTTSSFASTVPSSSHHHTGISATYARRFESRYARRLASKSWWGEATDEPAPAPAREDARPTDSAGSSGGYGSVAIGSARLVAGLNHEL